jgi:SAM-dependent methyltransferase
VREVIGVDIDPAVLSNPTTSRNIQLHSQDVQLPLKDESVDLIVCDYVLEHLTLDDLDFLKQEVTRLLKPGGFFCARTPHYWHYVCVGARLSNLSMHTDLLRMFQPDRKMQDVFPTHYLCNTHQQVTQLFSGWQNLSYTYVPEPSYFLGKKLVFNALALFHKLAPDFLTGNLFIFLKKA